MTDHPITPPPELVAMWAGFSARHHSEGSVDYVLDLATKAAQWGADQELEACCEWLVSEGWFKYEHEAVEDLHAARRPKPPSLKEQALLQLDELNADLGFGTDLSQIRRALEALPE